MKLLVFEYICSGGLYAENLPASLANEGRRMLQALLDELKLSREIQIVLLLDPRFSDLDLPDNCEITWVDTTDFWKHFDYCMEFCDGVLPIAPEKNGLLSEIASRILTKQKFLWLSDPETVSLCSHKLETLAYLELQGLPVIKTNRLSEYRVTNNGPWVIKPNDGLGCEACTITEDIDDIGIQDTDNLIVQAYITGDALSLSAVCVEGRGYLLSCNRQYVHRDQNGFKLHGCSVNIQHPLHEQFRILVEKISQSLPGLWGYIGIDLINSPKYGPLILEINPRLTTSYVGLLRATGVPIHLQLFNLIHGLDPDFSPKHLSNVEVIL